MAGHHRHPAGLAGLAGFLAAVVLALAIHPGLSCGAYGAAWTEVAALYTWQDEQGAVHVSDQPPASAQSAQSGKSGKAGSPVSSGPPAPKVETFEGVKTSGKPAEPPRSPRERAILSMLDKARALPGFAEVQRIAEEYHQNHTYSMDDFFVCLDMALELANILKTRGHAPRIVIGSSNSDTGLMDYAAIRKATNHAWVAVELKPGVQVAVEATGGYIADERVPRFVYYYQGLVFDSPREARDMSDRIRAVNEECKAAEVAVKEWNATYQGGPATARAVEAKGRTEARLGECRKRHLALEEVIRRQYRSLY